LDRQQAVIVNAIFPNFDTLHVGVTHHRYHDNNEGNQDKTPDQFDAYFEVIECFDWILLLIVVCIDDVASISWMVWLDSGLFWSFSLF
jgi:hypothetical protein